MCLRDAGFWVGLGPEVFGGHEHQSQDHDRNTQPLDPACTSSVARYTSPIPPSRILAVTE